jgi:hypothetical protein
MRHQIAQQQTAQQRHFVFNSCKNSSWHRYGNRPGTTASHVQDLSTSRFFSFGCTTGDLCVAQTTSYVRSSHVITYTLCGKRSRMRLLVLIRSSYSILSLYLNTGIVWIVRSMGQRLRAAIGCGPHPNVDPIDAGPSLICVLRVVRVPHPGSLFYLQFTQAQISSKKK